MKKYSGFTAGLSCFFLVITVSFCTSGTTKEPNRSKSAETGILSYAKRFKIERFRGYSQLTITNPWQGSGSVVQKWYLVPEGGRIPDGADTAEVINVPLKRVVCMSTTHLAMISALKRTETVRGFSGLRFIYSNEYKNRADSGEISDVGYEDNLNKELILKIDPDLVIAYGVGAESAGYVAKLKELGVRVIFDADYLEADPLGKTEWIKAFGALYSKEKSADSIFNSVVDRYKEAESYIRSKITARPKVLLGLPFRDTWFISPGNSYVSKLISDAGGKYLWSDSRSTFAMPVSVESVYIRALDADYWLNPGNVESAAEIAAIDTRFSLLPAFTRGQIYNNNNRINSSGGNDYWESGCLNPDIILTDIASILHPELFPGRQLYYYKKIK